ncbi:MAG: stage II sporulation protein P [Christensenellaceae bacterium]|jgi:stage II sporulation protein P|nr:stage II sporulation protein P [Christensenellaceae bacterium]
MKREKAMKKWSFALCAAVLALSLLLPAGAHAQGESIWTLADESGQKITSIAADVDIGDEYISGDNQLYRVKAIDRVNMVATMENLGEEPALSLTEYELQPVAAAVRSVGLYATHTDEAYEKGDGSASLENGWAGILDVASTLKSYLEKGGLQVELDVTQHLPHDAGAYRRSRATATNLVRQGAQVLFDVHRDGIPDPSEYQVEVDGEETTKVRLLVGRSNPNSAANKEFAKKIKAVGDEKYPGLIKDIFIGKGDYNQEILPQSVLLEFGTHTSDKEEVLRSTEYMADVLNTVLTGKSAGAKRDESAEQSAPVQPGAPTPSGGIRQDVEVVPQSQQNNNRGDGSGSGIAWILGLAVLGVLAFALLSGGFGNLGGRLKRFSSELTGGAVGDKPDDDNDRDE